MNVVHLFFPPLGPEAAEIRARMTPGTRVLCVENTYRPTRAGRIKRIVAVEEHLICARDAAGHRFRFALEPEARWVGPDTFVEPLLCEGGVLHTATFAFMAPTHPGRRPSR